MRRFLSCIAAVFLTAIVANAQTAPATQPSADDLVREVRASEDWIDHVKSVHMRFTSTWWHGTESIEQRAQELHQHPPTTQSTQPEARDNPVSGTLEMAFDDHRIFYASEVKGSREQQLIWDADRATAHDYYDSNHQESYGFHKTPYPFFDSFWFDLSWPRAEVHEFWWHPVDEIRRVEHRLGSDVTAFELDGQQMYHGINCWLLHAYGPNYERWYVGVQDHLLHGTGIGWMGGDDPKVAELAIQMAKANGKNIHSMNEFDEWQATLPKDTAIAIDREFTHREGKIRTPAIEFWMLDYREVAPGKLFPMTQGALDHGGHPNKPSIDGHEMKAVGVQVDQTLPDDLFKIEIKDGVQVSDFAHDPPLFYQSKHDRTPAEWQQIIAKAVAQKKMFDDEKARENAIVGKPAIPFPKTTWLNGGPLTWDDLKGKVVILDFFAEWCGPCRNDWPTLAAMHKKRDQTGIVIIGIHTPGSEQAKIDKVLKEFDMQYPICIDVDAPKGSQAFGMLSAAYGVRGIPHSFVIGPDGIVAGHGNLGTNLQLAYELAAKQKAATQPTTRP